MRNIARAIASFTIAASAACSTAPAPAPGPQPEQRPEEPREPAREAPLRIGVIVSNTGSAVLQRYAELVLEGVQLGVDAEKTPRRDVELVVRDDGGTAAGAARALRELEQAGVRVVIGPLVEDALAAAAAARTNESLLVLSPTATHEPPATRNVFALNVVDARGAAALGDYARRYPRVGVLHSRTAESTRQARAFMEAYSRGGPGTVHQAPFDSGATNISAQLRRLRDARVDALFFPGSERELQIVLPQVDYFGLSGVQMLGTESWLSDAARGVPQRVLEGAIIALPLWRESDAVAWSEFVGQYEARHRRSLDHPVPALGYDAARLGVRALREGDASVRDYRGATGVLTLQADSVTRKPFLVRLQAGRLVPVT